MANLGEKTAPCAVFSPKFGGGSGASGAGGGGRGSGQRQVHRCWGGTLARTASACMPQPDQVILPQVEHRAGLHMGVSSERHRDSSEPYPWGYRDVTPARHPSRRGGPPGWVRGPSGGVGSGGRAAKGGENLGGEPRRRRRSRRVPGCR